MTASELMVNGPEPYEPGPQPKWRVAALKALAKLKVRAADATILCSVRGDGIAEEISRAEKGGQCPMHSADQFEAFAKLHSEHGMSAEDIAARFGVTAAVVRRRLKLGAVSRKLIKEYLDGEMNFDQLTAFAITDDHEKQERVWAELPQYKPAPLDHPAGAERGPGSGERPAGHVRRHRGV